MTHSPLATSTGSESDSSTYTVVARRYRPKSFQELVGQEHISQALSKAIATGRVGHAYLFTGARGVGKTSSARIFAKALNAPGGPSTDPVSDNDIAQAIDTGDDVDVIEIDAASNRGIDEIRQLRANVSVRPSRSRYKIYIIDEVHMLTTQAFNALLKTLEEPPEHVKFIFCTTDPEKVPITVLSRCQRFDFAPVRPDAIKRRLAEICAAEGFEAEDDALALLARRAAGSMRDSQSLLEQVMSFSSGTITTEQVHELLGTADETRLRELAEALVNRDGVAALKLVDRGVNEGTDAGQFAEQLLGYLRDLMAVAVGGGPDLLKVCNPSGFADVQQLANRWGLQSILAAVQLLDESLVRMRYSVQSQALFEVALIQIAQLQDLSSIARLLEAVQQGGALPNVAPPRPANQPATHQALAHPAPSATVAAPAPAASQATTPPTVSGAANTTNGPTTAPEKKNAEGLDLNQTKNHQRATRDTVLPEAASELQDANSRPAKGSDTESASVTATKTASPKVVQPGPAPTIQIQSAPLVTSIVVPASSNVPTSKLANTVDTPSGDTGQGAEVTNESGGNSIKLTPQAASALASWKQAAAKTGGMLADFAASAVNIEFRAEDHWIVVFPPGTVRTLEYCEVPSRKAELQTALDGTLGYSVQIGFRVMPGQLVRSVGDAPVSASVARSQRLRQLSEHPLVSQLCKMMQGEIVRVDPPASAANSTNATAGMPPTPHSSTEATPSPGKPRADFNEHIEEMEQEIAS